MGTREQRRVISCLRRRFFKEQASPERSEFLQTASGVRSKQAGERFVDLMVVLMIHGNARRRSIRQLYGYIVYSTKPRPSPQTQPADSVFDCNVAENVPADCQKGRNFEKKEKFTSNLKKKKKHVLFTNSVSLLDE